MAYQTGTYSGINDALTEWKDFLLAQGWTINDFSNDSSDYDAGPAFTGKRLHIQKTIGSTTHYFNFRSCSGQRVFDYSSYEPVTGICVNGSTGYNAGNTWDYQPGYTPYQYGESESGGGCVDKIVELGGNYFFSATATSATAVFTTDSTNTDYRIMTIGDIEGRSIYSASGGYDATTNGTNNDYRSSYFGSPAYATNPFGLSGIKLSDGWYIGTLGLYGVDARYLYPQVDVDNTGPIKDTLVGSTAAAILKYSPEHFKGNAPLVPCSPCITKGVLDQFYPCGTLEGVWFLNMKNYSNETEIVIGANTYKLFKIFNPCSSGVAFLWMP